MIYAFLNKYKKNSQEREQAREHRYAEPHSFDEIMNLKINETGDLNFKV